MPPPCLYRRRTSPRRQQKYTYDRFWVVSSSVPIVAHLPKKGNFYYGCLAAVSIAKIAADRQIARQGTEPHPEAHDREEEERKCVNIVGKDVKRAEKPFARRTDPCGQGVQEEEYDEGAHDAVEDTCDHEGATHVPVFCSDEVHDPDLIACGVYGEADGIERDEERREPEDECAREPQPLGRLDDVGKRVYCGLVLLEIHFFDRGAGTSLLLPALKEFCDRLILRGFLRAHFERCSERIRAKLVERLKREP